MFGLSHQYFVVDMYAVLYNKFHTQITYMAFMTFVLRIFLIDNCDIDFMSEFFRTVSFSIF